MELVWIIGITALSGVLAYFVGGYIDRRAQARQEAYELAQRQRQLEEIVRFSSGFADLLQEKGLIAPEAASEVARQMRSYVLGYCEPGQPEGLCGALREKAAS